MRNLALPHNICALLLCLAFSSPSQADDGTPIPVQPADSVGRYTDAIDLAEAEFSAYSMELADLYLGLGQSLMDLEKYDESRKAFQHGMQIVRVNFGLNSPDQTNYLFSLADIEDQVGDLALADKILQNVYLINARTFGEDHPDMLPVLDKMLSWYLKSIATHPADRPYGGLAKAERITNKMAEIVELDKGLSHPDTANLYRRVGELNYHLAHLWSSAELPASSGFTFSTEGSTSSNRPPQRSTIELHFKEGTNAFTKLADSVNQNEDLTPWAKAESVAQLGDWYLTFGRTHTAGEIYQRAYRFLEASDSDDQLAKTFFERPTPVRFLNNSPLSPNIPESSGENELNISMTITKGGKVQDVKILNPPDHVGKPWLTEIKKSVVSLRFRPKMVDGRVVKSKGFILHYTMPETGSTPGTVSTPETVHTTETGR